MTMHHGKSWALALIALIGLSAGEARAANISMTIDLSSGPPIIVDLFTTGGTATDYGTVNLALLNAALTARGSAYTFNALGGQSNFPGTSAQGQLTISGGIQISAGSLGDTFLKITETETGFTSPTGPSGSLQSASAGVFSNADAGTGHTASSAFNGTSTPTYSVLSTGLSLNGGGGASSAGVAPVASLYSLTNVITFGLSPKPFLNVVDGFGVAARIEAAAVPEPASLVTMMMGVPFPLVIFGLLRRRALARIP
jgi:hypothetical protein